MDKSTVFSELVLIFEMKIKLPPYKDMKNK
jgi:hypothetical protein